MPGKESITKIASEYGGRLKVKSALNPILWLCGLIGSPCIIAIGIQRDPPFVLVVLLFIVVGVALFSFVYLLIKDPDRLQSEDYQLRKQTLELIEENGGIGAIDARLVEVISDPQIQPKLTQKVSDAGGTQ